MFQLTMLINQLIAITCFIVGIYTLYLLIKVLKIYIKKNS